MRYTLYVVLALMLAAGSAKADDLSSVFPIGKLDSGSMDPVVWMFGLDTRTTIVQAKEIFSQSGDFALTDQRTFATPFGTKNDTTTYTILAYSRKGAYGQSVALVFSGDSYWLYREGKAKDAENSLFRQVITWLKQYKLTTWGRAERCFRERTSKLFSESDIGVERLGWGGEWLDYRVMIADKVDRGEIQPSEADYLFSKKLNEIIEKSEAKASEAMRSLQDSFPQQQPPVIVVPLPWFR